MAAFASPTRRARASRKISRVTAVTWRCGRRGSDCEESIEPRHRSGKKIAEVALPSAFDLGTQRRLRARKHLFRRVQRLAIDGRPRLLEEGIAKYSSDLRHQLRERRFGPRATRRVELYALTYAATNQFNDSQEAFDQAESEIETAAREAIAWTAKRLQEPTDLVMRALKS
ncbi:MAG: hypothetical protein JST54_00620 [Deltaproteobacteria bacterium]|nr:hypothetical protein [Deltaproteobacteria bacterium]